MRNLILLLLILGIYASCRKNGVVTTTQVPDKVDTYLKNHLSSADYANTFFIRIFSSLKQLAQ